MAKTVKFNGQSVCILILNWNGWEDTIACLESVYRSTYSNYAVVVIDNGSSDNSVAKIKNWADGKLGVTIDYSHPCFSEHVINISMPLDYIEYSRDTIDAERELDSAPLVIIKNGENLGYAGGNNVGIRYALTCGFDYVLILNNDTVIHCDCVRNLTKRSHIKKRLGVTGGKIFFYQDPSRLQSVGAKMNLHTGINPAIGNGEKDRGQYDDLSGIDYVPGAMMLISRAVFEEIGLFDEDFFLYGEEVDFCYRARIAGFDIQIEPEARIWHKVSASSGSGFSETYLYYSTRNSLLFMKKHYRSSLVIYFWPRLLRILIKTLQCFKRGEPYKARYLVMGMIDGLSK